MLHVVPLQCPPGARSRDTPGPSPALPAAEESLEEVGKAGPPEYVLEVLGSRVGILHSRAPAALRPGAPVEATVGASLLVAVPGGAETVVLLALLGVTEYLVGLCDILEPLLRTWVVRIDVGVVLAGQPSERLADVLLVGIPGYA